MEGAYGGGVAYTPMVGEWYIPLWWAHLNPHGWLALKEHWAAGMCDKHTTQEIHNILDHASACPQPVETGIIAGPAVTMGYWQ